jgi:hypothetical protein
VRPITPDTALLVNEIYEFVQGGIPYFGSNQYTVYDEQNRIVSYGYGGVNNSKALVHNEFWSYSDDSSKSEKIVMELNPTTKEWYISERDSFYNHPECDTSIKQYLRTTGWETAEISISKYNSSGLLTDVLVNDWGQPYLKFTYKYNNNGDLETSFSWFWDENISAWRIITRRELYYNSAGKICLEKGYVWNTDKSEWESSNRVSYKYFIKGDNLITEYLYQQYENDVWANRVKRYDTTDAAGRILGTLSFEWQSDTVPVESRSSNSYDFMGNLIESKSIGDYREGLGWTYQGRAKYEYAYLYNDPAKPKRNNSFGYRHFHNNESQKIINISDLNDCHGKLICETLDLSGHMLYSSEIEVGEQKIIKFPIKRNISTGPVIIQMKNSKGKIIYKNRVFDMK